MTAKKKSNKKIINDWEWIKDRSEPDSGYWWSRSRKMSGGSNPEAPILENKKHFTRCAECDGFGLIIEGNIHSGKEHVCKTCDGTGVNEMKFFKKKENKEPSKEKITCPSCHGRTITFDDKTMRMTNCLFCNGNGQVVKEGEVVDMAQFKQNRTLSDKDKYDMAVKAQQDKNSIDNQNAIVISKKIACDLFIKYFGKRNFEYFIDMFPNYKTQNEFNVNEFTSSLDDFFDEASQSSLDYVHFIDKLTKIAEKYSKVNNIQ